jgi:23S rRNA pseudouridine955/2504/2580 synthase
VYEDENIIVINKPVGMVVHNTDDVSVDTLANRLKHYLYDKKE